ncbi:CRIB domain-containing protein RIC5-like [Chenopodium quinoa]|uniref:CRIB domain-containing protein RIC5-like n=1 Tax=Chenopodium quinoa TaxID=63459 RepID=UPI000B77D775|nr:CRIB domain-containing protein RIC5-like [Chenopodium quinoa]
MSMKMKGLLKGLRYISTIFDEEQETEMQIGFPTDVKHVAHIGWDGPTANSPSWINQFKDGEGGGGGGGALNVDQQNGPRTRGLVQEKRFSTSSDSPIESPSRKKSDKPRGSRRANSTPSAVESPRRSLTKQQPQQQQQQSLRTAEGESTSVSQKTSSRRKKTKTSSSRSSTKSKSTAPPVVEFSHFSDPGVGGGNSSRNTAGVSADHTPPRRSKGKDTCQGSLIKASEQEDQKALDDISRGIHAI